MSNNQIPVTPYGKLCLEEQRTNSLHPEDEISSAEDEQTVRDVVAKVEGAAAIGVTSTSGITPIMQQNLVGKPHCRTSYGGGGNQLQWELLRTWCRN